jgi:hypothetical protein
MKNPAKVHLLRYAHPSSLQRTFQVRLAPYDAQALHMELFPNSRGSKLA